MLKGNLSTRPFYNERLATAAIAVIALGAALLTVYNATALLSLSSERSANQARISRDQTEAARIRAQASAVQQTVDGVLLTRLADSTREANDIIDQRTFSWTAFFRLIEKTLPFDVRLVMVSPRAEKGAFKVAIDVVARTLADVSSFSEALRDTGAFYDVAAISQQTNDDDTYSATLEAGYLATASAKVAETPSTTARKKP